MAHVPLFVCGARPRRTCSRRSLVAVTLTVALSLISPALLAETTLDDLDPLTIRVYDLSGTARRLGEALNDAHHIFADAGIALVWLDCSRGSAAASRCVDDRRPSDLVVRILRRPGDARPELPTALGVSVIEGSTRAGALATVFIDLVEPVARRTGTDVPALLGRAIAHEVGHLLLGSNHHSATGLMRETWTDRELGRNDERDWLFGPADRGQLLEARLRVARQASARPARDQ